MSFLFHIHHQLVFSFDKTTTSIFSKVAIIIWRVIDSIWPHISCISCIMVLWGSITTLWWSIANLGWPLLSLSKVLSHSLLLIREFSCSRGLFADVFSRLIPNWQILLVVVGLNVIIHWFKKSLIHIYLSPIWIKFRGLFFINIIVMVRFFIIVSDFFTNNFPSSII